MLAARPGPPTPDPSSPDPSSPDPSTAAGSTPDRSVAAQLLAVPGLRWLFAGAVAALSMLALAALADGHGQFDLRVYSGAADAWLHGRSLYDYLLPGTVYGFTYPPFALLLMVPTAWLPFWTAYGIGVAVDAAIITGMTWWFARRIAPRYGWSSWYVTALAVPVVCLLEPVRDTVGFGQVNLMLAALVLADLAALRRGSRWAGVLIGLAAAVKLTPALFIVLLVVVRPRAARNAVLAGGVATIGTFVVDPATSWRFWSSALFDTSRVGHTDISANQALSGLFARLADAPHQPTVLWLVSVCVVAVVGLRRAVAAMRADDDLAAIALIGLTGGLISPITWTHHLWWIVPTVAVLLDEAAARRTRGAWLALGGTVALFASSLPDQVRQHVGRHLHHGPFVVVGENSYALACLVLLLALPIGRAAVRRVEAGPAPPREPVPTG